MNLTGLGQYLYREHQLPPSAVQGSFALDTKSNNIVHQQYYLLEKQEEQTLYILQLNEQNKQLQEQIEQLKAIVCKDHPESAIC